MMTMMMIFFKTEGTHVTTIILVVRMVQVNHIFMYIRCISIQKVSHICCSTEMLGRIISPTSNIKLDIVILSSHHTILKPVPFFTSWTPYNELQVSNSWMDLATKTHLVADHRRIRKGDVTVVSEVFLRKGGRKMARSMVICCRFWGLKVKRF